MDDREQGRQTQCQEQARPNPAELRCPELRLQNHNDRCSAKGRNQRDVHDLPGLVAVEDVKDGRIERSNHQEHNPDIVTSIPLP